MIIDSILDRKDGKKYNAKQFYDEITPHGLISYEIAGTMDSGEEANVRRALVNYLVDYNYPPELFDYVNGQRWLTDDTN